MTKINVDRYSDQLAFVLAPDMKTALSESKIRGYEPLYAPDAAEEIIRHDISGHITTLSLRIQGRSQLGAKMFGYVHHLHKYSEPENLSGIVQECLQSNCIALDEQEFFRMLDDSTTLRKKVTYQVPRGRYYLAFAMSHPEVPMVFGQMYHHIGEKDLMKRYLRHALKIGERVNVDLDYQEVFHPIACYVALNNPGTNLSSITLQGPRDPVRLLARH